MAKLYSNPKANILVTMSLTRRAGRCIDKMKVSLDEHHKMLIHGINLLPEDTSFDELVHDMSELLHNAYREMRDLHHWFQKAQTSVVLVEG